MATPASQPVRARPHIPARAGDESRVVAGVAAGLAHFLGLDPLVVRLGFVVLVPAGGIGVLVYVAAWLLMPAPDPGEAVPATPPADPIRVVAFSVLVLGIVLGTRAIGLWPGDFVFGALAIAFVALTLVFAPRVWGLLEQLQAERVERARSEARAEVSAHLHDSVLQTLALVQRRADDPREVVRLAREQERELRSWLLTGQRGPDGVDTLGRALEAEAVAVEREYGTPVEVVRARDCPMSDRFEPLVAAAREAMMNAARHSGAPQVSVFVEVEPERATVFVRDRGRGFDREAVGADRRGVSDSIEGRMARSGGHATVRTGDEGTEIELVLPRGKGES